MTNLRGTERGAKAGRFLTCLVLAAFLAAPAASSTLGDTIKLCANPDIRLAERIDLARAAGWQDVDSLTFPAYQELLVQRHFAEFVLDGQKVGPKQRELWTKVVLLNNPIEKLTKNGPLLTLNGKHGPFLQFEEWDFGWKYRLTCTVFAVSEPEFSHLDELRALPLPGFSGEKSDYVIKPKSDLMNRFSIKMQRRNDTNSVRAEVKVFVVDFDPAELFDVTGTPFGIDLELKVYLERMLP